MFNWLSWTNVFTSKKTNYTTNIEVKRQNKWFGKCTSLKQETKILGMSLAFRSVIQKQNRLFLVFFAQLFSSVLRLGSADPNTTWWRRVSAGPNTWHVVKFSEMQFEAQAVSTMVKNHFAWLFSPPTYGILFLCMDTSHFTVKNWYMNQVMRPTDSVYQSYVLWKRLNLRQHFQIFLKQPLSANHQWQYKASIWLHLNEFLKKKTALVINYM